MLNIINNDVYKGNKINGMPINQIIVNYANGP